MKFPNVALVGFMRSGKDSVAACLRSLDPDMRQVSFAGALKREVAVALNAATPNSQQVYSEAFFNDDANRPRFRPLLQWWGTEFRRVQDANYWVRQVETYISSKFFAGRSFVCTDGRFLNELTMLRDKGFVIVKLDMDVEEVTQHLRDRGMTREQVEQQLGHQSEREWQNFEVDYEVRSQFGNLPRLTAQIVQYLLPGNPLLSETTLKAIEDFYADLYPAIYGKKS